MPYLHPSTKAAAAKDIRWPINGKGHTQTVEEQLKDMLVRLDALEDQVADIEVRLEELEDLQGMSIFYLYY